MYLLSALLDPVHYMIQLGSKYEPNMPSECMVLFVVSARSKRWFLFFLFFGDFCFLNYEAVFFSSDYVVVLFQFGFV